MPKAFPLEFRRDVVAVARQSCPVDRLDRRLPDETAHILEPDWRGRKSGPNGE